MSRITRLEFHELLKTLHQRELMLNSTKGQEYAGPDDVLANFRSTADDIDMPLRKALYTHMHKHWSVIKYFCKTGRLESTETLESRINDLRLYLALLRAAQMEEEDWVQDVIDADGANF